MVGSTHRSTSMMIHPQKHYIGLLIGTDSIGSGKQYPVSGIVVDWQGNIINDVSEVLIKSQVEMDIVGTMMISDIHHKDTSRIPLEKGNGCCERWSFYLSNPRGCLCT